jgi:hypothetical protein
MSENSETPVGKAVHVRHHSEKTNEDAQELPAVSKGFSQISTVLLI